MATKKLSLQEKYDIADSLATTFDSLIDAPESTCKAVYKCLMHDAQIRISGKVYTLEEYCSSADDVQHITRLTMRRLTSPIVTQRSVGQVNRKG